MATGFRPVVKGRPGFDDYAPTPGPWRDGGYTQNGLVAGEADGIIVETGAGVVTGPFYVTDSWLAAAMQASFLGAGTFSGDVVDTIDTGKTPLARKGVTFADTIHRILLSQGEAIDEFGPQDVAGLVGLAPELPELLTWQQRGPDGYPIDFRGAKRDPYGYVAILAAHGITP